MRSVRQDKEPIQFLPFALRPGFQSKLAAKSPADLCGVVTVHARIEAGADIQQAMRPQVQAQRDCSGVHVLPSPNSSLVAVPRRSQGLGDFEEGPEPRAEAADGCAVRAQLTVRQVADAEFGHA